MRRALLNTLIFMSKGQRSRSPWPRKGKFQNGHKIRMLSHTTTKLHILMHLDKFFICLTILGSKVKVTLTLVMQNLIVDHKIWMFSPGTLKLHILMHRSWRALPATPFLGQRSRSLLPPIIKCSNGRRIRMLSPTTMKLHILIHLGEL